MKKSCIGCNRHEEDVLHPRGIVHSCKGERTNYLAGMSFPEPNRAIGDPNKRPDWCPKEAK